MFRIKYILGPNQYTMCMWSVNEGAYGNPTRQVSRLFNNIFFFHKKTINKKYGHGMYYVVLNFKCKKIATELEP